MRAVGIAELNYGRPEFILRLTAPDAELAFPGDNTWSTMFRPAVQGLAAMRRIVATKEYLGEESDED
jgi:hypothetical protein